MLYSRAMKCLPGFILTLIFLKGFNKKYMAIEPPFVTVRDKCQTYTDTYKNLKRMGLELLFNVVVSDMRMWGDYGNTGYPMDKAAWTRASSKAPKITHLT